MNRSGGVCGFGMENRIPPLGYRSRYHAKSMLGPSVMKANETSSSTGSVSQLRSRGPLFGTTLVVIGAALGLLSLAWISNQFGNTDRLGLLLFPLASGVFVTGLVHLFFRLPIAILAGVVAVPIAAVLPFVFYWCYIFGYAFHKSTP